MAKPNFLCIGTQKSGTTWLYENLAKHSDVWSAPVKELHYFNRMCMNQELLGHWDMPHPGGVIDRYKGALWPVQPHNLRWLKLYYQYGLSKKWYYNLFDERFTKGKVCGDITPGYCTLEDQGIRYVKDVVGQDTPVIFIVRNPIERSWSAAKMMYRYRGLSISEKNTADLCKLLKHPTITLCSEYTKIIQQWRRHFNNFHVLTYDELCEKPEALLKKISGIIGISEQWDPQTIMKRVWSDKQKLAIPPPILAQLEQQYRGEIESTAELLQDKRISKW